MKTHYIFESQEELFEWLFSALKASAVKVTADARGFNLYVDVPKEVLNTPYPGFVIEYPHPDATRAGEETIVELGGKGEK